MNRNHAHGNGRALSRLAACVLGVSALLAWAAGPALAGSSERLGTGGALELRIPVGPRGSSLGGSVVGDVSGIEAAFWNPAGLGTIEHTEAMFSNTQYFADMKLNYAAIASRVGNFGTLGLQVKALSVGDIIVTTEAAPEGTGEVLTPTFTVIGGTWGRQFTDKVLFGASANFVTERIADVSANGVAFDFGVQYRTGWRNLQFGVVMKNFGTSMQFNGPGLETSLLPPSGDPSASNRIFRSTSSSFEMPSYFALSGGYDLVQGTEQKLRLLGSFQNNNFASDNLTAGMEWNYRNVFAVRGAYFGSIEENIDPDTGDGTLKFAGGDNLYSGLSFGAGAQVKLGSETRLGIDLSWRQVDNFFDDIIETGVHLTF